MCERPQSTGGLNQSRHPARDNLPGYHTYTVADLTDRTVLGDFEITADASFSCSHSK